MADAHELPHRIAGNIALDLANTISWTGTEREEDHIADTTDIVAWATAAGLVGPAFEPEDGANHELVRNVHRLRDAVRAAGSAIATGRSPPTTALSTVRDLAARSLGSAAVDGVPATVTFPNDPIVGPLAWAAFDLLRGDDLKRLKQCPACDCRWLFIDRTKNGSRRWCDMATCGDRAKKKRR